MTNKPSCEKDNNVKKITVIYIQSKEGRASVGLHFAGICMFLSIFIIKE